MTSRENSQARERAKWAAAGGADDIDTAERVESSTRSKLPRIISAAFTTAISSVWIGPWALLWLAAYAAFEHVFNPWFRDNHIMPYLRSDPVRAGRMAVINIAMGAALWVSGWGAAWIVGGMDAAFVAGLYFAATTMHALIYFGAQRESFIACIAPATLLAIVAPFFTATHPFLIVVMLAALAQSIMQTGFARQDRNAIMKHLWKSQAQIKAAQKASMAKSQFLATMSHELRTPLNAVIGYAEILEEDLAEDGMADKAEDAARIRRSARDLLLLINEILDFSKIEAGRMEVALGSTNVNEIIEDVVRTTAHISEAHGVKVIVEGASEIGELVTDGQRLRQCLLNLVSNACKFTENGTVTVRAALEGEGNRQKLRIDVIDTGCGISAEDSKRLFQPFVQADGTLTRAKGGTGLGLVITKRLAELLGGDVTFVSSEGGGSTFTLRVKAHEAKAEVRTHGEGPAILVIEDEASARDLFRRALGRLPLAVIEATTAHDGFARAKEQTPSLIVLDIHLPDRSGWNLLAEFKAHPVLQNVPVLVVSIDDDRARALRLGACDHLVKPVDRERLAASVIRFALAEAPRTPASPAERAEDAA